MAWTYDNKTGILNHNNIFVYKDVYGYAGTGDGRNNPTFQCTKDLGPIPSGKYRIGKLRHGGKLGPLVLNLNPIGHNACGRTLFRIHGNNDADDASTGCIILPKSVRKRIGKSKDKILHVLGPIWF